MCPGTREALVEMGIERLTASTDMTLGMTTCNIALAKKKMAVVKTFKVILFLCLVPHHIRPREAPSPLQAPRES